MALSIRVFSAARRTCAVAAGIAALALAAPAADAQPESGATTEAAAPAAPKPPPAPEDPYDRGTPRSAVEGFLTAGRADDWERAAEYLDLRHLRAAERDERGRELARDLKGVLDRTLWVDLAELSEDPAGLRDDGLPAQRDLVGRIDAVQPPVPVYVDRVRRDDGVRIWKIASVTLREVPALAEQFGDGLLAEYLPEIFLTWSFLEIRLWQWIGLMILLGAAALVSWMIAWIAARILSPLWRRVPVVRVMIAPLAMLIGIGCFSGWRLLLGLSLPAERAVGGLIRIGVVLALTWMGFRLVNAAEGVLAGRASRLGNPAAASMLTMGRRAAKTLVLLIALLGVLQNLGVNITALVAGLGVGGLAVALAAQKSLENLFGGITIVADQPVRVGDFCRFGDQVGTVEDIGLRSTRIRTLDRTVVTIPNAEFSSLQLENFAARDRFWWKPKLGLRYETTPDQMRWVLVEVRKLLYSHPRVDPDPARVRFVSFGAYSLDIEIFAYIHAADVSEYLEIGEDLNLRIMEIIANAGTGFAFPSQTLYVGRDEGLDAAAARRSEAEVADWREAGALPLPGFPPDRIRELGGSLDYPPKGSALRRSG
ncbi:mechanosensitive ion channel family protein [Myxococcota bacterium]|nr:mechanosensitive ion channel family protein [Myxococcota bacterium]MCZ7617846.1 mechanosensitive ion channel [Myxococcota bacterium]